MTPRSDASNRAAIEDDAAATTGTNDTSAPRHGKRAVAAVATTLGAAALASAALAVPAQATSPNAVWDRVAHCESTNNWHINTGNGFYGGLQFTASTWHAYHGGKYASRADHASRLEQIEVARRVLASQGPGAWPVCGPRAGLTRSSGHATHAALPSVAGRTVSSHAKTTHKKASHKASKHHKGTHHKTYRVRSGDTLSKIAHRLHVTGGWHALYHANRKHLSNPNVIHVGQVLTLP
jgi:resuscitation-promoting factor RpfA